MDRLGSDKEAIKKELQYFKEKGVRVVILDIPTTTLDISGMDEGVSKEMINMINNVLIEVLSTIAEQERKKQEELEKSDGSEIIAASETGEFSRQKGNEYE